MDVATPEQAAEGTAIVNVLAAVLDKLVLANCHHPERNCHYPATKFHAMKPPGIAIQQYLERYVRLDCGALAYHGTFAHYSRFGSTSAAESTSTPFVPTNALYSL